MLSNYLGSEQDRTVLQEGRVEALNPALWGGAISFPNAPGRPFYQPETLGPSLKKGTPDF